ncbi:FCD domain-containing protein [Porphyrobacter algicida]|uniref:FCD domain-containing protein n=1 Tax=Qipengyuania algicida TaxID=1836209 RepID=A0A845AKP1_9SPHN|nr:FCD domain-containing protein [Qipengyuania algicida]MXP29733.1 FCD domain-containing protein [Qipengyuania algicida]
MALVLNGAHSDGASSLVQRAVDAVNAHMLKHELKVGDTLPGEGHFAEQLGVSRAVMREAFGALAALRLIDVGNGRRPRVGAIDGSVMGASMSHAVTTKQVTVAEVWDVRRTLELRTAELAARNRTDEQVRTIIAEADAMMAAGEDLEKVTFHDIRLHQAISQASGNMLLIQIIRSFEPLMHVAVPAAWHTRETKAQRQTVLEQHRHLAEMIAIGDANAASAAMHAHFERSIGSILESL